MTRNTLPALKLGLATAALVLAVAGSSTASAQTAETAAAPAASPDGSQAAQPAPAQLSQPPYYQPDPQAYPQQPYPQPYPQQAYPQQAYPQQAYPAYPQQPYYGQQPYPQQPVYVAPPYAARRVRGYTDRFRPQFGIGLRVSGLYAGSELTTYGSEGLGLEFLLRVHPRVTLEALLQYQNVSSSDYYAPVYYYDRYDLPILGGARIHLGNPFWVFSPYVVGAAGATYSRLSFDPSVAPEGRWFFEAQGGVGFEIRLGRHFLLNADLRAFGRFRNESTTDVFVQDTGGNFYRALGNSGGILFNFGFAGLF